MDNKRRKFEFDFENYHITVLMLHCEEFTYNVALHSHSDSSYEIHYIPKGSGNVLIDGKKYMLYPGILYVTGPNVMHEQITDGGITEYCIYLQIEENSEIYENARIDKDESVMKYFRETVFWYGEDKQEIVNILRSIFRETAKPAIGMWSYIVACMQQLVIRMVRNYMGVAPAVEDNEDNYNDLFQNKGYISSQYDSFLVIEQKFLNQYDTVTLKELSGLIGLGTRQTERLLKQHYGMSFIQKRTEARMSAAIIMMKTTKMTINEIAVKTGYASAEHFTNCFRRYTGVAPGKYRKSIVQ